MNCSRIVTALVFFLSTSACVAPPRTTHAYSAPSVIDTQAPRCTGKSQCEALWVDAQRAIESVTGMRVRMVTDGRITTFPSTGYSRLGGEVAKYPMNESTYELRVYYECYRYTDCSDLRVLATNLFNKMLGGTAMPAQAVAPAKEAKRGCDLVKDASGEMSFSCPD
jgi:hypothetical protein